MANFHLFAANGKGKWMFVILGRQTINGNQQLLCQQMCPSMQKPYCNCDKWSNKFSTDNF